VTGDASTLPALQVCSALTHSLELWARTHRAGLSRRPGSSRSRRGRSSPAGA